jgi:hypothetical protein
MQGRRRAVASVLLLELEEVHSAGMVEGWYYLALMRTSLTEGRKNVRR